MKGINKIITIDGIDVPMRASAASPRIYRTVFGKDLFLELTKLRDAYENNNEFDLEIVENMAYLFAYQANEDVPDIDEWLDQFGIAAVYDALPEIIALWNENEESSSKAKK